MLRKLKNFKGPHKHERKHESILRIRSAEPLLLRIDEKLLDFREFELKRNNVCCQSNEAESFYGRCKSHKIRR